MVPYAQDFLPVFFFFKCCFKNTCFQEVKFKGVLIFKQVSPLVCNLHQGSSKCLWTCSSLLKLVSI